MQELVYENMIQYKGYAAEMEYDSDHKALFGSVVNMDKQGIHFSGATPKELKRAMKETVDAHLEFCEEWNIAPELPFSGRITYRTTPQNHAELAKAAILAGKRSINAFIDEAVGHYKAKVLDQRL